MSAIKPASETPKVVQAQVSVKTVESNSLVKNEIDVVDYAPISDSKNVKRYVTDYFVDVPVLAKIAGCESHYRQLDKSDNPIRGEVNRYDVGVMQINELYHLDDAKELGYDIYTLEGNVAYGRYLYERDGSQPWVSSSACWAKDGYKVEIARR